MVIAGRLAMLALAAAAVVAGLTVTRTDDPVAVSSGPRYVCPMHPEILSPTPGICPICRMALTRPSEPIDLDPYEVRPAWPRMLSQPTRAAAWLERDGVVTALLYADEIAALGPEQPATFTPTDAPDTTVAVRLVGEAPESWDEGVARVRFRVERRQPTLAPGAVGWLKVATPAREAIPVPLTAIVQSPQGPYVLVEGESGHGATSFVRRPVRLGRSTYGMGVIVSGLRPKERVAMRSALFLDVERRLTAPP